MTNAEICARYGGVALLHHGLRIPLQDDGESEGLRSGGKNPLYNVVVYVNNTEVSLITNGATAKPAPHPCRARRSLLRSPMRKGSS